MYDPAPAAATAPAITELCARINAASFRLLQLVAELDDENPWGAWGLKSCAHWLNWRCGIGLNAAREKVCVAHALRQLPLVSACFASGELSFSRVRALTRIAEPANEQELLDLALNTSAAQVEKLVRAFRRAGRLEANEQYASRELIYYHEEDGSLVIRARLPAEDGAVLLQALDAAMAARDKEQQELEPENVTAVASANESAFAQRRADALLTLAETTLRHGPAPSPATQRYQVVVHVTAETFSGDDAGRCELESRQPLAPDTVSRIACDSSLLRITEDEADNPLDIGRKTRAVPPAIRRALQARDGGCRFPGCGQRRFVGAHHIRHWADGGNTSIDNLVLLCRHHHRLVHEGGFGVARSEDGSVRFKRPDGHVIEEHPELPATGGIEGLTPSNRENGKPIDAVSWIIPRGTLDYGIAIEKLKQVSNLEFRACQTFGKRV